jgi:glycosyltransferase involved in cell wall biosynthesis
VLSSYFEGLPNGLMEAMAMGLPVIATDCKGGGARAVVQNEMNGLLVPTGNVEQMAAALERYMDKEEFAFQMGAKARNTAERFKTKAVVDQWEAYVKETVGR